MARGKPIHMWKLVTMEQPRLKQCCRAGCELNNVQRVVQEKDARGKKTEGAGTKPSKGNWGNKIHGTTNLVPLEERKCRGIIEHWELNLNVECKSQTVLDKSPSSSSTQARGKKEQVD